MNKDQPVRVPLCGRPDEQRATRGPWGIARETAILPVRIYQKTVAPLLPPACRYHPTCSQYFIDAVRKRGVVIGVLMGVWRILRCHPWGGSGIDEA